MRMRESWSWTPVRNTIAINGVSLSAYLYLQFSSWLRGSVAQWLTLTPIKSRRGGGTISQGSYNDRTDWLHHVLARPAPGCHSWLVSSHCVGICHSKHSSVLLLLCWPADCLWCKHSQVVTPVPVLDILVIPELRAEQRDGEVSDQISDKYSHMIRYRLTDQRDRNNLIVSLSVSLISRLVNFLSTL